MPWKLKQDLSKYKKGDIVPDDLGIVWNNMYLESPVEYVPDSEEPGSEDEEISKADVNRDGKVDLKDVVQVVKNLGKDHTKSELYEKAKEKDLDVSWKMRKKEIARALAESE